MQFAQNKTQGNEGHTRLQASPRHKGIHADAASYRFKVKGVLLLVVISFVFRGVAKCSFVG